MKLKIKNVDWEILLVIGLPMLIITILFTYLTINSAIAGTLFSQESIIGSRPNLEFLFFTLLFGVPTCLIFHKLFEV